METLSQDRQDVVMDALCHAARMQAENARAIAAEPFTRWDRDAREIAVRLLSE